MRRGQQPCAPSSHNAAPAPSPVPAPSASSSASASATGSPPSSSASARSCDARSVRAAAHARRARRPSRCSASSPGARRYASRSVAARPDRRASATRGGQQRPAERRVSKPPVSGCATRDPVAPEHARRRARPRPATGTGPRSRRPRRRPRSKARISLPTSSASARSPPASSSVTTSRSGARVHRGAPATNRWRSRWCSSGPRALGVVVVLRPERDHLGRQRPQRLDGFGARCQGLATRFVGERHGHRDARPRRRASDRVALHAGEVVESVEQHRIRAPGPGRGTQCVDRPPREQLAVDPAEPLELVRVVGVDPAQVAPVGGPAHVLRRPLAQRRPQPRDADELALQLSDQRARRRTKPRGRGRRAQRRQLGAREHAGEHAFALELGQSTAVVIGALRRSRPPALRTSAPRPAQPRYRPARARSGGRRRRSARPGSRRARPGSRTRPAPCPALAEFDGPSTSVSDIGPWWRAARTNRPATARECPWWLLDGRCTGVRLRGRRIDAASIFGARARPARRPAPPRVTRTATPGDPHRPG